MRLEDKPMKTIFTKSSNGLVLCLACLILLSACNSSNSSSRKNMDADSLLRDLLDKSLAVGNVTTRYDEVVIELNYGYEEKQLSGDGYEADVKTIASVLCNYGRGFSARIIYADRWFVYIDKRFLSSFCAGFYTPDELISLNPPTSSSSGSASSTPAPPTLLPTSTPARSP